MSVCIYLTLQRRKLRFSEITLEANNGSKWGNTDWTIWPLGPNSNHHPKCPTFLKNWQMAWRDYVYGNLCLLQTVHKHLRKLDVTIVVMLTLTSSSLQKALELAFRRLWNSGKSRRWVVSDPLRFDSQILLAVWLREVTAPPWGLHSVTWMCSPHQPVGNQDPEKGNDLAKVPREVEAEPTCSWTLPGWFPSEEVGNRSFGQLSGKPW